MKSRLPVVKLDDQQRSLLYQMLSAGKQATRTLTHARLLLKADANQEGGAWSDDRIAEAIEVGTATVERVRARFAQQGLDAALYRKKTRRSPTRSLEGDGEAHLVALTCSAPPEGTARWTLRLLANGMVERGYVDTLSHETVRQTLKKRNSSPG